MKQQWLLQDCKWRLILEQKWLVLVDLDLADSQINLWADWEALVDVECSHGIARTVQYQYWYTENTYHGRHQASRSPGAAAKGWALCVCWGSLLCAAAISYPLSPGTLEPSSHICSPAVSSYVLDLLFSAVARACAGSWLHANGLFMLSLFTLVYLFSLLSFFLFHFLWYGTNVPGCVETLGWAEMAERGWKGERDLCC